MNGTDSHNEEGSLHSHTSGLVGSQLTGRAARLLLPPIHCGVPLVIQGYVARASRSFPEAPSKGASSRHLVGHAEGTYQLEHVDMMKVLRIDQRSRCDEFISKARCFLSTTSKLSAPSMYSVGLPIGKSQHLVNTGEHRIVW